MAYGVNYRAEWLATTRGERHYVVDFLKRDYDGAILPMHLTGECITITYGARDESELQPIKSNEAEITVLCTEDDNRYSELYTLDASMYKVVIYEDGAVIWRGYLATGQYQQPLAKAPYVVRFRANDGLAVLKAMPYLDFNGQRYTEDKSVSALIRDLLSPISDSVDVWHYALLYAGQSAPTLDIVSITQDAIYLALGAEATYYDVLEAVLKNFGVQLLQQSGGWVVRSLDTLATAVNSSLVKATMLDNPASPGYGISSDAVLSFLPPLKKLTVASRGESNIALSDIASQPTNWQASSGYALYVPKLLNYGNAIKISAISNIGNTVMGIAALPIRRVYTRSQDTSITLTADIYSGNTFDNNIHIGVWLVKPSTTTNNEVVGWDYIDQAATSKIAIKRKTIAWDSEDKKWQEITTLANPTPAQLGLSSVTLKGAPRPGTRPALSTLEKTSISFELPYIPDMSSESIYNDTWEIVLVVSCVGGTRKLFYISNVAISTASDDNTSSEDIHISNDGISAESYDAIWRTTTTSPNGEVPYMTLVDTSKGNAPVYGYIEASASAADKGVVSKMLIDLRHNSTYNIEGIVDKAIAYGVNNVVRYDNRYYYTNYVRHLLKRGVSDIQLRELPQLTNTSGSGTFPLTSVPKQMIGLTRSLYFTTYQGALGRVDVATMSRSYLDTSSVIALRTGVRCVVAQSAGRIRAYDDRGMLVAEVTDFLDDNVSSLAFYATAVYDAVAKVWIASDRGANVVICEPDGFVISRLTCAYTPTNPTDYAILPYNGGFVYRFADGNKYYSYWHSFAIHEDGVFEDRWSLSDKNITHISDRYIVYRDTTGRVEVLRIMSQDLRTGISAFASIAATNEVIAVNNALILTRGTSGAAIYDTRRTVSQRYYSLGMGGETSIMALCGDVVLAQGTQISNGYSWKRILNKINSTNNIAVTYDD